MFHVEKFCFFEVWVKMFLWRIEGYAYDVWYWVQCGMFKTWKSVCEKKSLKTNSFLNFYVNIFWQRKMRITLVHLSTGSHSYATLFSYQEPRRGHRLSDKGLNFFGTTSYCYCHGQQCIHLLPMQSHTTAHQNWGQRSSSYPRWRTLQQGVVRYLVCG